MFLAVLNEFLLTSVQVWEKKIRFKKSDKIVDTVNLTLQKCIYIYYTLRFYFPYLSLLAQPVTIFVFGPVVYGSARYLHYFR
jgi:hypothetical protein